MKVAVVTGGTSGMGLGVAKMLLSKGYYVYAENHKVQLTGDNPIICNACTIILKKQDCEGLYCVYN